MTLDWGSLPLLPLRCIMDHLSTEDALAAMSTCRHWRNAILLYEARRNTFEVRVKQHEKNMFVARIFKKHTRNLHIYIDCTEVELEKFMNLVLPLFFDTVKLQELVFIGPRHMQQSHLVPFVKLNRVITESLVFRHLHNLQRLVFLGCVLNTSHDEDAIYNHKQIEYFSRPLNFNNVLTPADAVLSSGNQHLMQFSTLNHIIVDFDQISTTALRTLADLPNFQYLTLNITNKKPDVHYIDWISLQQKYKQPLQVIVNIIAVPIRRFSDIMAKVFVPGLLLSSLKVMFCKTLYTPLLSLVSRQYAASLQEVVWLDSPCDSSDPLQRVVRPLRHPQPETFAHVNQFVLLCWQCVNLKRLVIHGYWVWQYDLLGFVRLRKTLTQLEVSAIYEKQDRFCKALRLSGEGCARLAVGDAPSDADADFVQEVNEFTEFKWSPTPLSSLPCGLRAPSTPGQRARVVLREALRPPFPPLSG